jgi:hypothetical protein
MNGVPGYPTSRLAAALMPRAVVIENISAIVIHTLGYRFDLTVL